MQLKTQRTNTGPTLRSPFQSEPSGTFSSSTPPLKASNLFFVMRTSYTKLNGITASSRNSTSIAVTAIMPFSFSDLRLKTTILTRRQMSSIHPVTLNCPGPIYMQVHARHPRITPLIMVFNIPSLYERYTTAANNGETTVSPIQIIA